jgi:hypothetical protein
MIGIVVMSAIGLAIGVSVWLLVRDVRKLHRSGARLTDSPVGAGGVSAAGMALAGSTQTH